MHNCKKTTERITELLLDGGDPRQSLSTELRECAECRAEFRVLKETLQLTTRLMDTATPPDSYWPGYHARLKEKLHAAQQPHVEPGQFRPERRQPSFLSRLFRTSIRIPVPVGLALILISVVAFVWGRGSKQPTVSIVHVPVEVPREVPVVQEKTITQIVYKERPAKRSRATRISAPNDAAVASLDGFKPAEEVKLTVIKGGAANEK